MPGFALAGIVTATLSACVVPFTSNELGVTVLQVGCGALGSGTSLPDAEDLVANLRASGHTVDIDDRLLAAVARYFDRLARCADGVWRIVERRAERDSPRPDRAGETAEEREARAQQALGLVPHA